MNHLIITDFFIDSALSTLSPKDLYIMRCVNKDFHKIINYHHIKQSIAIRVARKIKNDIKIPYDKFNNFLHKYDISICGSFLLQCILDENFEDCTGIDLLINKDSSDIFESFKLIQHEYQKCYKVFYTYNEYFAAPGHHIRFIITDISKSEFIQNMTSFDICKNLYDTRNIYVSDLIGILNKKEKLKNAFTGSKKYPVVYSVDKLVKKYINRGFRFKKLTIPNIYTKNTHVVVYTKTHFMINKYIYI